MSVTFSGVIFQANSSSVLNLAPGTLRPGLGRISFDLLNLATSTLRSSLNVVLVLISR